ncbi:MAG TPA: c-type cytochrome [Gammaproteobacteria bacterium]|nr:c-type cytochrome [Gammaproteobacteria bacterium]
MGNRFKRCREPGWRLAAIACLLAGAGCADKIPPSKQRPGDPKLGYELIINGGYESCGLPYEAWRRTRAGAEVGPTLPGRHGRNRELPYFLSAHRDPNGVEIITPNCLLCHAALFNGELVIGLGNEAADFTTDPRDAVDAAGLYVSGPAETAAWKKWAQRIDAMVPYSITDTLGVNPAPTLTLALIAHRDPKTLAWSEKPLLAPPPEKPIPTSVPPWWRVGKKNAMFYNGMGRGDHARYMMMKSLVCADSVAEAEAIDAQFVHVRAYLASLKPPAYPFAVDRKLAAAGGEVYERRCAKCHGRYGNEASYPNLIISARRVGTDPVYAESAYEEAGRFMDWFNRSWFGRLAQARPRPGYVPPPLDGIWATAPYLHNGSVPTMEALLDSSKRPTYWTRSFDSRDYDPEALGWRYTELRHGKAAEQDPEKRKRLYDTTLPGYANTGHTYGDRLKSEERRALIEYLKTLGG